MQNTTTFETHSDHLAYLCDKGEFKRFSQTGLLSFSPENFIKLISLHRELLSTHSGTERSGYTFGWHMPTHCSCTQNMDTAFGNKVVDFRL